MRSLYTHRCNQVNTPGCLIAQSGLDIFGFMNFAQRIKAAREHAGLTQAELAKRVELPQQVISKLENGKQYETAAIAKIANACGVNPSWLDTGNGEMMGINPKIAHLNKLLEGQPDYVIEEAIKNITSDIELLKKAKNNGTK